MHSNRPDGCDHDPEDQDPSRDDPPESEPGKWATIQDAITRWGSTTRLATILLVIEAPALLAVLPHVH
jgi:hypothetical protein